MLISDDPGTAMPPFPVVYYVQTPTFVRGFGVEYGGFSQRAADEILPVVVGGVIGLGILAIVLKHVK